MRKGKLAESALNRSVLRQLHTEADRWQRYRGSDCAVFGGVTLLTTVNEVPGCEEDPGSLIIAAANGLAAGGAQPEAFLVSALLPADCEEPKLRADMRRLAEAAEGVCAQGADNLCVSGNEYTAGGAHLPRSVDGREMSHPPRIIGGHTQVSDAVTRPVYSVTGIGRANPGTCRAEVRLQPGDALIVTEAIALAGTAALAARHEEALLSRYPFSLVDRAKQFGALTSVGETARAITHFGTAAVHDLSQGGIFNALWEMAERADVGLEVDLKRIPIRQETVEICEYFDINPYYLYSAGSLLVGTAQGEALVSYLAAQGIRASVIGSVTADRARVIRNGEDIRYLDRPQPDEWYRTQG